MDHNSIAHYSTYQMELHVSYCIYPKVQKENYVWGVEKGYCGDHQEIMRDEAGRTHRWESVHHVHMYVAIAPKLSVSEFKSYLKGKSALV